MGVFAQMPVPSLNPVGVSSVFAAVFVAVLVLLASPMSLLPVGVRHVVVLVAPPLLMVVGNYLGEIWSGPSQSAEGLIALCICFAFAFGFALRALRSGGRIGNLLGFFYTWVIGVYVLAFAEDLIFLPTPFVGLVVSCFAVSWPVVGFMIIRRQVLKRMRPDLGRCAFCAYDLRGSADRPACPECGHEIDPVKQRPYLRSLMPDANGTHAR